ncbi:MAG TPA: STT3 domain-containing protein, partial [Nitrospirota bacterium]|nr:STT3 domain-containing protein [Nitrospirota bacterium]
MNDNGDNGSAAPYPFTFIGWAWLFVCVILAFILRALPYHGYLGSNGQYLFYGPDAYDHLRRITMGLTDFPRIPTFDSYYGYPVGTGQIWSPLFDYLISATAFLAGGRGNPAVVYAIGFWLPPMLGALTVLLVYRAGVRIFSQSAGMAASLMLALLPGHIIYSFVSEIDHHSAEVMVAFAIFLSALKWADVTGDRPMIVPGWFRTGFWMAFAIMIWRGSIVFWGVLLSAQLIQLAVNIRNKREVAPLAENGMRTSLATALILLPICIIGFGESKASMSFGIISWFHIVLLLVAALVFLCVKLAANT